MSEQKCSICAALFISPDCVEKEAAREATPPAGEKPCVCHVQDGLVQEWISKARAVAKSKGHLLPAPAGETSLVFEVVVNGQPVQVPIESTANVRAIIEPALAQTGTLSRPESEWEVRLTEGQPIHLDQPIAAFAGQRLWINLRAGYAAGETARERTAKVQRYDLMTNYRCGSTIEERERSDDGEWVRFEDIEAALRSSDGKE